MTKEIVGEFMFSKYGITPSDWSLEILVEKGFEAFDDEIEQLDNLDAVQEDLRDDKDEDSLVARIFALAYSFNTILRGDSEIIRRWTDWLGGAEYSLGGLIRSRPIKRHLNARSLDHLLIAREHGNDTQANVSRIGKLYVLQKNYKAALPYLEEAFEKGDTGAMILSRLGKCYHMLRNYAKALEFFEKLLKIQDNLEALATVAECYFHLGNHKKALEVSLKVRARERNRYLDLRIADSYFALGNLDDGMQYYESAVKTTRRRKPDYGWMRLLGRRLEAVFRTLKEPRDDNYVFRMKRFQQMYKDFTVYCEMNNLSDARIAAAVDAALQ